jgi:hypothetical protein
MMRELEKIHKLMVFQSLVKPNTINHTDQALSPQNTKGTVNNTSDYTLWSLIRIP